MAASSPIFDPHAHLHNVIHSTEEDREIAKERKRETEAAESSGLAWPHTLVHRACKPSLSLRSRFRPFALFFPKAPHHVQDEKKARANAISIYVYNPSQEYSYEVSGLRAIPAEPRK